MIGDALLAAIVVEDRPGAAKAAAALATHRDAIDITLIERTCSAFSPEQRRFGLPFAHHRAVLDLDPRARSELLDQAAAEHWTGRQIRRAVLACRIAAGTYVPPFDDDAEDKSYRVIVQAWNRASRGARAMFIGSADEADLAEIIL